ncbi:MAG: discoidin domain-containing protein [Anaerolineae bacterium]|nr:discoidin domain-containing protein [Anaerolineae bacterium]
MARRAAILLVVVCALLVLVQGGPARAAYNAVDIYALSYHPSLIAINAGESVSWYNFDGGRVHTIISDTGAFYSGPIYPGRFFAVQFSTPGTYPYHDNLYPSILRGVVIVNERPQPTPPGPTPTPLIASAPNLALNRPASASDALRAYPPSAAVDGRSDTAWANIPSGSSGFAAWLQVDLGSEQTFNQAVIQWGASYAEDYALFAWLGNRWTPVAGNDHGNGGNDRLNFAPVRARYVRLWTFQSSDLTGQYQVAELALYQQTEAVNLALDRPAYSQGYEGNDIPARAVDGDLATQWTAPPGLPQLLAVNLQAPYAVERVVVYWAPDHLPPAVSVYGYDNTRWNLIERRLTATNDVVQTFAFSQTLTLSQVSIQAEPVDTLPAPPDPLTATLGVAVREVEIYGRALLFPPRFNTGRLGETDLTDPGLTVGHR